MLFDENFFIVLVLKTKMPIRLPNKANGIIRLLNMKFKVIEYIAKLYT